MPITVQKVTTCVLQEGGRGCSWTNFRVEPGQLVTVERYTLRRLQWSRQLPAGAARTYYRLLLRKGWKKW